MGNSFGNGYFDTFRNVPAPTLYGPNRTPVTQDVLEIGFIVAFSMTWFCVILASLGMVFVNWRKWLQTVFKATFVLYFITCILVAIWGFGWRVGAVHTETTYKQFTNKTISADVGLKVGLYAFNVTLKGNPTNQSGDIVDYNEHYNFGILQGRLGFGSQAGLANREFRAAQIRGTPLPILWIAEYFTIDGERIRWGRDHRQAGYYTALLLWTAFCFFFLTIALLPGAIGYGANMLILTGLTKIIACCVYAGLYNELGPAVAVPFETATLTTHFGWSFILTLVNGLILFFLGVAIWLMYLRFPEALQALSGFEILDDEDGGLYISDPVPPEDGEAGLTASKSVEATGRFSRSARASRRHGTRGTSIRSPAVGNYSKAALTKSLTIDESNLEASQSAHGHHERGISVRRLRRTVRKKPRAGGELRSPGSSSPTPMGHDLEMSVLPNSSIPLSPSALAGDSASPTRPLSPLTEGGPVTVSVKGAVGRKAFSLSQGSSQAASFEMKPAANYPTLDEGDEDVRVPGAASPLAKSPPAISSHQGITEVGEDEGQVV